MFFWYVKNRISHYFDWFVKKDLADLFKLVCKERPILLLLLVRKEQTNLLSFLRCKNIIRMSKNSLLSYVTPGKRPNLQS